MKKMLLPALALAVSTVAATAQTKTYAFTSERKGEMTWTAIRELDFSTGEITKTLYSKTAQVSSQFRTVAGAAVTDNNFISGKGVAAAAFDKNSNKLYFTEMYGNELKFVDLSTSATGSLSVGVHSDARFSTGAKKYDESNVITRMAFTNDGVGYALTNDANSLIKFTTGASPVITNLGELKDAKKNGNLSIHSQCTSWGGDMIGDIYGNLYLITMRNNVFKINITKMEAEFVGSIKNLPAEFTTNGAAADDEGNILLSSASNASNYYKVNPSTLEATTIKGGKDMYNVSDLANGNLVYQSRSKATAATTVATASEVAIYPNPAVNKNFNISFNNIASGNYNIAVTDVTGKAILTKQVNVLTNATEKVSLPKASASGVYMLRVTDANGKTVSTSRVVVE